MHCTSCMYCDCVYSYISPCRYTWIGCMYCVYSLILCYMISVYNQKRSTLYCHHDIILPAFPLATCWINYDIETKSPGWFFLLLLVFCHASFGDLYNCWVVNVNCCFHFCVSHGFFSFFSVRMDLQTKTQFFRRFLYHIVGDYFVLVGTTLFTRYICKPFGLVIKFSYSRASG